MFPFIVPQDINEQLTLPVTSRLQEYLQDISRSNLSNFQTTPHPSSMKPFKIFKNKNKYLLFSSQFGLFLFFSSQLSFLLVGIDLMSYCGHELCDDALLGGVSMTLWPYRKWASWVNLRNLEKRKACFQQFSQSPHPVHSCSALNINSHYSGQILLLTDYWDHHHADK